MTMTDPIADLATRIRNGTRVGKQSVKIPHSKLKAGICEVLKREGFIQDFSVEAGQVQGVLNVDLKYGPNGEQVIQSIQRISRPGCRVYFPRERIRPVLRGMGIMVLTTNQGVLSDREARKQRVGGEPMLEVW